ncbi:hypothetical protein PAAG_08980 [Paracoccidioides lutzii Pb01]|uniref:Adhesin n=1 Tax=Paracoccidioides lutzii (strain ATCC MYA-826 / Pb01) TaxID=502779 RepID=C1HDY7_PARBA|nr:hypothetical protein PAAG_08980 [Paracoccidioides lutzii Pb01]EEH40131.2 hypothetical protein PAAG_08980 [Paracoccidioides lutzii Pb01]
MLNIKVISTMLLITTSSLLATAHPAADFSDGYSPKEHYPNALVCPTCNPVSGKNFCDITTSCINMGYSFHCACRAGYKATKYDDPYGKKQFRLPFKHYEFLVFTPEKTECNTLCNDPTASADKLCSEVPLLDCKL